MAAADSACVQLLAQATSMAAVFQEGSHLCWMMSSCFHGIRLRS